MKRTREQAAATRAVIINAAQQAFYENGAAHTSLDDVARRAGVTRGAIYWHFRNKLALFNAMFEQAALPLDPFSLSSGAYETDPLERLLDELRARWRHVMGPGPARRLYTIMLTRCENARETAAFCERVGEASRQAELQIRAALHHAVMRGQLPAQFDAHTAARLVHATLSGLLRKQLMELDSIPDVSVDVVQIVRDILQRPLGSDHAVR